MSRARASQRRLPPLLSITSPVGSEDRSVSPRLTARSPTSSSHYHRNCCPTSRPVSPGPGAYLDVYYSRGNVSPRNTRIPKSPRSSRMKRSVSSSKSHKVVEFLDEHEKFLEEYILDKVDLDLLERWMIRKTQRECKLALKANVKDSDLKNCPNLSRWKFCVHADKRQMLQELTSTLYSSPSKFHVLYELAHTVASSVNASSWTLYIYQPDSQELVNFGQEENETNLNGVQSTPVETGTTLASYVARKKEAERIKTSEIDLRYPDGVPVPKDSAAYVLCHPIMQPDGDLSGVLELYRTASNAEFHEEDEEIVNSYLVWGGIALHYAELFGNMMRQRELNTFLLTVVKSIFQDMISMDKLIVKIMMFARKLVNADRASLFLVDGKSSELFARIFDMSGTELSGEIDENESKSDKEIRFPIGKGIAGYVAMTGESLNIPNAYNDDRFNRSVDQQTGYVTRNLLCMPIFIRGSVIGVVQMVNKMAGTFTKDDEEAFATFAVYCGLALHHAKLYEKIRRSEQKYKVALEILSYHNTSCDDEAQVIDNLDLTVDEQQLTGFDFFPTTLNSDEKVAASIIMFNELTKNNDTIKLEPDCLMKFTLTVRKNYRRVPYHNWAHGFTVANSIFALLTNNPGYFTPLEELSLYISSLCHDLDHRGKTNQFMVAFASPLAAIYTTSTLEHHHFNMTVTILQQEGRNILKNLTSSEYKQVLSTVKHCILATDLSLYFPNKAKLSELVSNNRFDWNYSKHRMLLQGIMMTGSDLCASTKGWDQQKETVNVIFEEFYDQGDAEKAQGKQPIPMMDRDKKEEQPVSQVGFLKGICIPCYELLYTLLPNSKPMLDGCRSNLEKWEAMIKLSKESTDEENEELTNGDDKEATNDDNKEATNDDDEKPLNDDNKEATNDDDEEPSNDDDEESSNDGKEESTNDDNVEPTHNDNEEPTNNVNEESTNEESENDVNEKSNNE